MNPDLELLIHLQRLDRELRQHRDEISSMPARIAALAARTAETQATLLTLQENLAREEKLRRASQSDTTSLQDRAARLQRQADSVTTTAQANALSNELAHVRAEIDRLETEELTSMERTEALEPQLPEARLAFDAAEANVESERLRGGDRLDQLNARNAALEAERNTLRPTIPDAVLSTYDRIARSRGIAVAQALDQKCTACQMLIRPQRWNELRDRSDTDSILTCESCGRLLYYDPARDAPQKKAPAPATAASPSKPERPDYSHESIAARIVRGL